MLQDQYDQAAVAIGKTATYSGGVSAFWFGMTANEIAAYGGLAIAIIGVCVQVYFGRKRDRRESEFHAARLDRLNRLRGEDDDE